MRDSAKAEFDRLQSQFKQAQAAFQRKLEEVRSERAAREQRAVDKVNMALIKSNAYYLIDENADKKYGAGTETHRI